MKMKKADNVKNGSTSILLESAATSIETTLLPPAFLGSEMKGETGRRFPRASLIAGTKMIVRLQNWEASQRRLQPKKLRSTTLYDAVKFRTTGSQMVQQAVRRLRFYLQENGQV